MARRYLVSPEPCGPNRAGLSNPQARSSRSSERGRCLFRSRPPGGGLGRSRRYPFFDRHPSAQGQNDRRRTDYLSSGEVARSLRSTFNSSRTSPPETPNLAARLQGIAEPNTVVIAESTRKLLGNLFDLEDLGAKDLKGIAGPVRAWAALRPSSVESRFEALHASGLTALVGREEELELLLRRWSRAKTGEGQVVLLSGEAGIGKSRLTAALLERLAAEPHTRLRYFCSPQHTDSALYPIIGQMERAAGLAHDDTPQAKLDKLDAVLAQTSTSIEDAALFAEMLSLPNDGRYPALELTPEQRRQRTLEALTAQLARHWQANNPVLMIFEDAHWTDPTSLEVFGRTVDRIKTLPVLLIVTFRPEFNAPWVGRSHVTSPDAQPAWGA